MAAVRASLILCHELFILEDIFKVTIFALAIEKFKTF
jgi:hypothetical protein